MLASSIVHQVRLTLFKSAAQQGVQAGAGISRIANHTNLYQHGTGLPLAVIKEVMPKYIRISEDNSLTNCLHGKTQNQNESLNGMVWQRIPKEVYVGSEVQYYN